MATADKAASPIQKYVPALIIVALIIVSHLIFHGIFGDASHFENNDPVNGHPHGEGIGKWLGTIYKGGVIVPFLMSFLLIVVAFSVERAISLSVASGKGSVDAFVRNTKRMLAANQIDEAIAACDKQKGSVANVMKSVLVRYKEIVNDGQLTKDQKGQAIQKEIEDATSLEMPSLEQNLIIIATLATVSTLVALLGTVIGMIKAFSALATAGAPDAAALSTGISEALINTAMGIGTSAVAIIVYNYFTNQIDGISHKIDETGFAIIQNFSSRY